MYPASRWRRISGSHNDDPRVPVLINRSVISTLPNTRFSGTGSNLLCLVPPSSSCVRTGCLHRSTAALHRGQRTLAGRENIIEAIGRACYAFQRRDAQTVEIGNCDGFVIVTAPELQLNRLLRLFRLQDLITQHLRRKRFSIDGDCPHVGRDACFECRTVPTQSSGDNTRWYSKENWKCGRGFWRSTDGTLLLRPSSFSSSAGDGVLRRTRI
jgi:hypothetical protein